MDPVYELYFDHLGDTWASLNFLAHQGVIAQRAVKLSRWFRGVDRKAHIEEIRAELDLPGGTIELVEEPATVRLGQIVWGMPYFPTRTRWTSPQNKTVCFHFEGVHLAEAKNAPLVDQSSLLTWAWMHNLDALILSKHLGLSRCIAELSRCHAFVGICSGPAHVAHSVGCPMFLLEYGVPLATAHYGNPGYVPCRGFSGFMDAMTPPTPR